MLCALQLLAYSPAVIVDGRYNKSNAGAELVEFQTQQRKMHIIIYQITRRERHYFHLLPLNFTVFIPFSEAGLLEPFN